MQNLKNKSVKIVTLSLILIFLISQVLSEEKIIQQENIIFEKCLKVITTSENKLSLAPEIIDVSDKKRVAIFTLADGTLKITCDGDVGSVTVSTTTD